MHEPYTNIQIIPTGLLVGARNLGGISAYQYRIDDAPISQLIGAGGRERTTSTVLFGDGGTGNLAAISEAKRLRVQIFTVLDSVLEYDIDMSRASEVLAVLASEKCN